MAVVKPPSAKEEDELDELPPIDGDGDVDDAEGATDEAEELDENGDDGGDPLDDSTGESDELPEIDVGGSESGWLDDAGDADALDVGTPETFGDEEGSGALLDGAEESDETDEEMTFGNESESIVSDAGEEGFDEEDESVREEDLPRLDSGDDDAENDDPDLSDTIPDDDSESEPRPPWDDRAWERADGESAIAAVSALACTPDGVVVGGEGIAWVDAAGKATALDALGLRGGAPLAVVSDGTCVVVATPRAGVLVSRDKGQSFTEANGWRALAADGAVRDDSPAQLVMAGGDLWARTKSGALLWSGDRGATWSRALADKRFEAIACDTSTGELVAVARSASISATGSLLARGSQGRATATECAALPAGPVMALAAEGGHVALGIGHRGAFRSEGDTWTRLEGTASLTAMAYGRGGTLLVALGSEADGRAWLVEARGDDGPARTVAELGDPPSDEDEVDARVTALAWDDVRSVVWVAGPFGLVAMRPARH